MKREKKWDKAQKLRAIFVELVVVAEDMEEYNNVENDELILTIERRDEQEQDK